MLRKQFLTEDQNSCLCPGKRDTITYRKLRNQKQYLNDTIKSLYKKNKIVKCWNPDILQISSFDLFFLIEGEMAEDKDALTVEKLYPSSDEEDGKLNGEDSGDKNIYYSREI